LPSSQVWLIIRSHIDTFRSFIGFKFEAQEQLSAQSSAFASIGFTGQLQTVELQKEVLLREDLNAKLKLSKLIPLVLEVHLDGVFGFDFRSVSLFVS
jgi:hypothetical protein